MMPGYLVLTVALARFRRALLIQLIQLIPFADFTGQENFLRTYIVVGNTDDDRVQPFFAASSLPPLMLKSQLSSSMQIFGAVAVAAAEAVIQGKANVSVAADFAIAVGETVAVFVVTAFVYVKSVDSETQVPRPPSPCQNPDGPTSPKVLFP